MAGSGGPRQGRRPSAPAAAGAWDAVVQTHLDPVYRFVLRRVRNPADAEDLTGEVFLRAWRWLSPERGEREVGSWLFRTARSVLVEHWRARAREGEAARQAAALPGVRADGSRARAQVETLLARLPSRYRTVLTLRFLENCSVAEAARRMALRPGNLRTLQYRALREAARLAEGGNLLGPRPGPQAGG